MTVDEMAECLLVATLRAGDEIAVHRGFLPATLSPGLGDPLTHVDAFGRRNWAPRGPGLAGCPGLGQQIERPDALIVLRVRDSAEQRQELPGWGCRVSGRRAV